MAFETSIVATAGGAEMIRSDNEFDDQPSAAGTINYPASAPLLLEVARQLVRTTLEADRRVPELDTSPPLGSTSP